MDRRQVGDKGRTHVAVPRVLLVHISDLELKSQQPQTPVGNDKRSPKEVCSLVRGLEPPTCQAITRHPNTPIGVASTTQWL